MKHVETKLMVLFSVVLVLSLSGCANMRPVVNENGGGGVAITTQQGSWLTPVVLVGGVSYALVELFDSLKDRPNNYNYYGDYTQNTAGGDNTINSGNRENPKRIRGEVFLKRGK